MKGGKAYFETKGLALCLSRVSHLQVSKSSFHVFINSTSQPLDLMYFYGEPVVEVQYGTIQPGSNLFIGELRPACSCIKLTIGIRSNILSR